MELAVTVQEIQGLLDNANFMSYYGFRLHSISEGECTIEVPFQALFERPGGVVNGPVFMAAADCAMWFAIMTRLGLEEANRSVTIEMKTNFLSGGKEAFLCSARVLKLGKQLIYGVAECVDSKGKLLTHHTLTYIRP